MAELPAPRRGGPFLRLPLFEGPLDLLLHLCRRQAVSLAEVPLATVTAQFLAYLDVMERLELEVAGEFVETAALLCLLKSRELLPTPPPEEPGEAVADPRRELLARLLDLKRYRALARELERLPWRDRDFFLRPAVVEGEVGADEEGALQIEPLDLLIALRDLLEVRRRAKVVHEAPAPRKRLQDRLDEVMDRLRATGASTLWDLLTDDDAPQLRAQLVLTILALLELARQGRLRMDQPEHLAAIAVRVVEAQA